MFVDPPASPQLMMPVEMLFLAIYFWMLAGLARRQGTDLGRLRMLKLWTAVQTILFLLFLILVYAMQSGFMTICGAVYLLSLGLAFAIAMQMGQTIESTALA